MEAGDDKSVLYRLVSWMRSRGFDMLKRKENKLNFEVAKWQLSSLCVLPLLLTISMTIPICFGYFFEFISIIIRRTAEQNGLVALALHALINPAYSSDPIVTNFCQSFDDVIY